MAVDFGPVLKQLAARGLTLAVAESLTGGLISKSVTDVPGASAVFRGGVVSYQTPVKARLLGVDQEVLDSLGPVSRPVARAMAEGVRSLLDADLALAVTGVAGPDPDEFGAPVGLVYVALAGDGWSLCRELHLAGTRSIIRELTCEAARDLLAEQL